MLTNDNPILFSPHRILIPNKALSFIDEKLDVFKKNKLNTAPLSEKIGLLSGYELIESNENCGGFCNPHNKQIAVIENTDRVVLHELAHTFQVELGVFDKFNERELFSDILKLEQQCEAMARYMYENIYNKSGEKIYNTYFTKSSIKFLSNWWEGWADYDLKLKLDAEGV